MSELLGYTFFRNALLAVIILSVGAGLLGSYIVTRRLVSISGGITHACFGGLGLGYYAGISPIATAMVFAVGSALGVQWLGSRGHVREDSAIAVVWAAGMAIGITFVFLTPGAVPELNAFLFGNILTVTDASIIGFSAYTLSLILFFALRFKHIVASAFDPDFAGVSGMNPGLYNGIMTVFIAVGIVLLTRCVGMMLLMAMLTLPQLTAEMFCSRLRTMIPVAIAASMVGSTGGLLLAAAVNVPASALIVGLQLAIFLAASITKRLSRHTVL